ncbi:MAG TPA: phytanoyl-CoA dioxygenase family protein [Rhizomicrobium sp.]|nr:phytanoyl-CoA dioxygenase family protein [Rhizomicrobium sp.]
MMLRTPTRDEIDAFQRDGAVCLRGMVSPSDLENLRDGIDANLAHPSPRAKIANGPDDPGRFIEDFRCWPENTRYRSFIFDSGIGEAAAMLMQSQTARLYHDHMLTKEAQTQQKTPWHQDQPYYNIEGMQNCSFWIPVDRVERSATLEFVAGSHKGPWLMPRSFMDNQAKWFPPGSLQELPDIEARRSDYPVLGWALEPGDIVCFHMLALHASGGTTNRRRVFSLRFLGDDIVHEPRAWTTSPDFSDMRADIPRGAPMQHVLFPVVWPQAE